MNVNITLYFRKVLIRVHYRTKYISFSLQNCPWGHESFDIKMVLNKIRYYTFNICKRFYDKPLDHFTIYNSARQFPKRLYRFMFSECHIYVTYYLNFDHIIGHTIFLNIPWSLNENWIRFISLKCILYILNF